LEADTATIKYAKTIYNAVSAGFISRDDLFSRDSSAKIRVRLGHRLYQEKQGKELAWLGFAYRAIFLLISGHNGTDDSQEHSEIIYDYYKTIWHYILGLAEKEKKDTRFGSEELDSLAELYNYLFKK
jgi:hypothetical protein